MIQDPEIFEEALRIKAIATKYLNVLNQLRNKLFKFSSESLSHQSMIDIRALDVKASEKMHYLLRAHLLAYGKIFRINRGKSEVAYIDYQVLKDRLSKQMSLESIKKIIHTTQQELVSQSTRYIQKVIKQLDPKTNSDILFIAKQLQVIKKV